MRNGNASPSVAEENKDKRITHIKHTKMFGIGTQELLVIALIILLLFGGKKIPELMKGLGKGVKSFKDGMKELDEVTEDKNGSDEVKKE